MTDDTPHATPPGASGNPASRKLPEPIETAIAAVVVAATLAVGKDDASVAVHVEQLRAVILPSLLPAEMTPAICEVLGLPNFRCGPIAHAYRAAGHSIRPKSESEQAFILFRFLHLALQHGPGWYEESCIDVAAALDAAKAKLPIGGAGEKADG